MWYHHREVSFLMLKKQDALLKICFLLYCTALLWILFFRRGYGYVDFESYPYWHQLADRINLIPLITILEQLRSIFWEGDFTRRVAIRNLAANLLLFMPMGAFLPLLWDKFRQFAFSIKSGFGIILIVELIQLFTLQGSFDIDDIVLNGFGFLIGYLIFRFWKSILKEN